MNVTPLGHNEAKAIRINESGLYSLVLGSKQKQHGAARSGTERHEACLLYTSDAADE